MCVPSTLTSGRIWAGNGSTNLRVTMPTSAQALAHTSAAQTQPTARYGVGPLGTGAPLTRLLASMSECKIEWVVIWMRKSLP